MPDFLSIDTVADVRATTRFLELQGTFHFPTLSNGLFCAAAATHDDFALTGYQSIWVRDNVHVAYAHDVLGDQWTARRTLQALLAFQFRHRQHILSFLDGSNDRSDPMNRPHIRFDGVALDRLPEKWAHAQNDALSYLIWLAVLLTRRGRFHPSPEELTTIADLVHALQAVEYWRDADSGHWEEARKIEASSIGVAVAALQELANLLQSAEWRQRFAQRPLPLETGLVEDLLSRGRAALAEILPWECRENRPEVQRRADAALLFLIDPLDVVSRQHADEIIASVQTELEGAHGIRRYRGDSYWCADYRTKLSAETRTTDFSDDMSSRDRLLQPGEEAQWCIFDPILSVIYGRRYLRDGQPADLLAQQRYLRRSLSQLTPPGCRFGAWRCPESYFLEQGQYVPNDITPLLWTQANLRRALAMQEQSLERSRGA